MLKCILFFLVFFASFLPLTPLIEWNARAGTAVWILLLITTAYWLFLRPLRFTKPLQARWKNETALLFPLLGCRTPMPLAYHLWHTLLNIFRAGNTPGYKRGDWFASVYVTNTCLAVKTWGTSVVPFDDILTLRVVKHRPLCTVIASDGRTWGFSFYRLPMRDAFVKLLREKQVAVSRTDSAF